MACILVLRDRTDAETYFLSGTGFQATKSSATTYSAKEGALVDGMTQRESLGNGALLTVKDLVSGEEHAVPHFSS